MSRLPRTALTLLATALVGCHTAPGSGAVVPQEQASPPEAQATPQTSQWWLMRGQLTAEFGGETAEASLTLGNLHIDADGALQGEAQLVLGSWRSEQTPELAEALSTEVWDAERDVYLAMYLESQSADTVTVAWQGPSGPVSARMPYTVNDGHLTLGPVSIAARSVLSDGQRTVLAPWLQGPTLRIYGDVRMTDDIERAEVSSRLHWRRAGANAPAVAVTSAHLDATGPAPTRRERQRDASIRHPQAGIGDVPREAIVLDP